MLPWERVIYVTLMEQYLKEKSDEAKRQEFENQHSRF